MLPQVAFGSDFSQPWSDKALGLKHIKGDGTIGFLIDQAIKGVELSSRNPLYWVSVSSIHDSQSHVHL